MSNIGAIRFWTGQYTIIYQHALDRQSCSDWIPFCREEGQPTIPETATVEHVLPQKPLPDSEWIKWFPDAGERSSILHKLGNLALLTRKKNSSARNYDFDKKKTAYFAKGGISPFVLTTQVLRNAQWTPAVVSARQQELLAKLEHHWKLEGRQNPLEELLK